MWACRKMPHYCCIGPHALSASLQSTGWSVQCAWCIRCIDSAILRLSWRDVQDKLDLTRVSNFTGTIEASFTLHVLACDPYASKAKLRTRRTDCFAPVMRRSAKSQAFEHHSVWRCEDIVCTSWELEPREVLRLITTSCLICWRIFQVHASCDTWVCLCPGSWSIPSRCLHHVRWQLPQRTATLVKAWFSSRYATTLAGMTYGP